MARGSICTAFRCVCDRESSAPSIVHTHTRSYQRGLTALQPQVAYAEKKTKEFLQTARENSLQKVEVITGAGNNSGKGGPKIKIAIQNMFNEMGLDFESQHGSFIVYLKGCMCIML